jgi:putative ATP-binding cassette transporter
VIHHPPISIAHRAAVLRHHTHVLHLMGEGAWEVHGAKGYEFDRPVARVRSNGNGPEPARQAPELAAAG